MARFSLVLCTVNRCEEVARLFKSIVRQQRTDIEVIVVDQNEDDRIASVIAAFANKFSLRHIRISGMGLSRARNVGLEYATGDLIAFPDDDCSYLDGCLDAVDELFQEDPSIDCVTGNPVHIDGGSFDSNWRIGKTALNEFNILNRCQEFTIFLRKEKLGGVRYNESLGVGADTLWGAEEGPDFLIQLLKTGVRASFFPGLLVYHPNKVLVITDSTLKRTESYARGRGCLFRMHHFPMGTIFISLVRPSIGCVLYLLMGRRMRSIHYFATTRGLLRGLFMSKAELAEVRYTPPDRSPAVVPVSMRTLPQEPLVSILIANYNYARFLPDALDSILAQTYTNWHAVVCDDGSTDDSLGVIRQYADRDARIQLLSKANGGQNSTYNACYRQVRGEIICFLDADDAFHPDKVRRLVEAFQRSPEVGICNHFSEVIDKNRCPQPVTMHTLLDEGWLAERAVTCGACVYAPTTSCMSLRREIGDMLFPIPSRQERDLDGYIAMASQLLAPIGVLPDQLSQYRIHSNNMGGLTEPTRQRLEYELKLIETRVANVKEFARQRVGNGFAERIVLADNPQYIQAFLKLLAVAPPSRHRLWALPLIRRHPNRTWRMIWRMIFAVPKPFSRMALPWMHRSYKMKAFVHGVINRRRAVST